MCLEIYNIPREERTAKLIHEILNDYLNPNDIPIFTEQEAVFNAKILKKYTEEDDIDGFNSLYRKAKNTV